MDIEQVRDFTLSLLGVTEDQPFGDDVITYRIEGKIFLCLSLGGGQHDMRNSEPRLALKLTPERNEELRENTHLLPLRGIGTRSIGAMCITST